METTKCCKCGSNGCYSSNGLHFCGAHYKEFLETKLYRRIKSLQLDPLAFYYIDESPFNALMVTALLRYFKHNENFFQHLRFAPGCSDFEDICQEVYGHRSPQVFVEDNESDIELIATPGQFLAAQIFESIAEGVLREEAERFRNPHQVYLLEDLSLQDCEILGANPDDCRPDLPPALIESSLEFRKVIGALRRVHLAE